LNSINKVASKCADALARGDGKLATSLWDESERVIDSVTSGVNLYNILKWNDDAVVVSQRRSSSELLLEFSLGVVHGNYISLCRWPADLA